MKMFGRELTANEIKCFVESNAETGEIRMPSAWAVELIDYKEQNEKLSNQIRIVQAELKRQYDRVDALMRGSITYQKQIETQEANIKSYQRSEDALTGENKILSERVKELDNIVDSWKKQYQILCDKHYANLDELKQLRKAYFELKADNKSIVVITRCEKCK